MFQAGLTPAGAKHVVKDLSQQPSLAAAGLPVQKGTPIANSLLILSRMTSHSFLDCVCPANFVTQRALNDRKRHVLHAPAQTDDVMAVLEAYKARDPKGFYDSVWRIVGGADPAKVFAHLPDIGLAFVSSVSRFCQQRLAPSRIIYLLCPCSPGC